MECKKLFFVIVGVLTIFTFKDAISADQKHDIKQIYELQERCSKRAEEYFNKEYGATGIEFTTLHSYTNHYNKKLNTCFINIRSAYISKDPETLNKLGTNITKQVIDIHEHATVGYFSKFEKLDSPEICTAAGTTCSSESVWDLRILPFMTE